MAITRGSARPTFAITGPGWNLFRDGCPNGESPAEVGTRAHRLIARGRTMKGDVALFSHCQFGAALAARRIGLGVIEGRHFSIGPASLSLLGYDIDHATVVPGSFPINASSEIRSKVSPDSRHCALERRSRLQRAGFQPIVSSLRAFTVSLSNEYIPILAGAAPWRLNRVQPWRRRRS